MLRQQYALQLLSLLENKRRIINVDESWLNQTRFVRKMWAPSDVPGTFTDKAVQPRISLLAALDTDGRIWCALTQANTDADVMTTFLRHRLGQYRLFPGPFSSLPGPVKQTSNFVRFVSGRPSTARLTNSS